jgi:ABC-type spermidine/putrescine transport system permease subunit II
LALIAGVFLVPVLCFFLFPIFELQKHFLLHGLRLDDEWITSTLISLLLALYSGALGWVAFQVLIRCRSSFHRFFSKWIVLSPMMLMLFWMSTPLFPMLSSWGAKVQFFAVGFLISCTQLPLIAKWIEDRKQAVDSEVFEAAAVLGTGPALIPERLLIPMMRDFEVKVFSFIALKSFGEIAVASFVAPDVPLLAIVSRQFAARYNFFGVSWILLVMGLMCVLLLGLQNGKWLFRNRAWFRG